jgi:hypothetical protein
VSLRAATPAASLSAICLVLSRSSTSLSVTRGDDILFSFLRAAGSAAYQGVFVTLLVGVLLVHALALLNIIPDRAYCSHDLGDHRQVRRSPGRTRSGRSCGPYPRPSDRHRLRGVLSSRSDPGVDSEFIRRWALLRVPPTRLSGSRQRLG